MKSNRFVLCLGILFAGSVSATDVEPTDINYYTIKQKVVREVSPHGAAAVRSIKNYHSNPSYQEEVKPDPLERAGKVISTAKDLVALGEDIYKLISKGKPTIVTKYAPISVIPKENNEPVDVMTLEYWQMPEKRSFEVAYKNFYNFTVVKFRYSVIFAHGGSYNGKGAYLTAVQIIPESVSTAFGYDFTATMKLAGIQNMASREAPVAGATLLLEYTVNTLLKAQTDVDTVFVNGNGDFKKY
jgi:hypothetical protein